MATAVGDPNPPIHDLVLGLNPQLADTDPSVTIESLEGRFLFDTKLDGVRALAAWDGTQLTLRNRNGRVMDNYGDLEMAAQWIQGPLIVDGEIISESGKFQEIAWRDKQRGAKAGAAMQQTPAYFVAFDILWHPTEGDTRHLPYSRRRELLELADLERLGGGRWSASMTSTDPKLYDAIKALGGEGVVAKALSSRYEPGRRKTWLKFKHTATITCVITGYEPGKGSRAALGAVFLAVIGPDGIVDIGRAGSGFTLPESLEMKQTLDAARTAADLPIVEIKSLGLTRDGQLRQPVYLGLRSDLTLADAVASQLDLLPRS